MSIAAKSRKILSVMAVIMGLVMAGNAHAEAKIAVVDFQRVFMESPQYKLISQLIQSEFAPRQRDLQQRQKDLQAKQDKLQRDGAVMSESERGDAERNLTKDQRDFNNDAEALKEDLNARQNEEVKKLQERLVGEIHDYAKANGYDIVLSGNGVVLYLNDTYDITNQIVAYLQVHSPEAKSAPAGKSSGSKPAK